MTDRYCVIGNPVAHSRSPAIHARFAAQCHQDLSYEAILVPLDGFAAAVGDFAAAGGKGANVTLPFKEEAFGLCSRRSARAERAGAVNTLAFGRNEIFGDNTDGAGLVRDIEVNLGFPLAGRRVLLLGAGGAARGVLAPLLQRQPAGLFIANPSGGQAETLAGQFSDLATVNAGNFAKTASRTFDVVINATSASLYGATLPLPAGIFASGSLAYDMMYGKGETPFLALAREQIPARLADGLGMLVPQAGQASFLLCGVGSDSAQVLAELREQVPA